MVETTLGGRPFSGRSALAFFATTQSPPGTPPVAVVIPSSSDLTCDLDRSDAMNNTATTFANSTILGLLLWPSGGTATAGTYSVGPTKAEAGLTRAVGATYYESDSSCGEAGSVGAVDGTVSVSAADATGVAGDFDLTFSSGDRAMGHFDAPRCVVPFRGDLKSPHPVCIH
jgi:hypothetical protein